MSPLFNKVIIYGVGQIGASIGMNLMQRRLAQEVVGVGRHTKNLREAVRRKAIHHAVNAPRVGAQFIAPSETLGPNDLIILATPVRTIRELLKVMPQKTLIIDVGSTKQAIVAQAKRRRLRFIGCHPIAGTEKGGAAGAVIDLFRGKVCLMTPATHVSAQDRKRVQSLWTKMGAKTLVLDAKEHDRFLGLMSHLPHVIAFSLANMAFRGRNLSFIRKLWSGLGSFKGATRVVASPVAMCQEILIENRRFVLKSLDDLLRELKRFRMFLRSGHEKTLVRYLEETQKNYWKGAGS